MKVRLKIPMSGLRGDGSDWPPVGTEMDVDAEEGAHLCQAGIAEPVVEDRTEKAVPAPAEKRTEKAAPAEPEKRTTRKGSA